MRPAFAAHPHVEGLFPGPWQPPETLRGASQASRSQELRVQQSLQRGTPYVEFEVILFFPQALGIESEDDLYKLVNFFLRYQAHHLPSSQVS